MAIIEPVREDIENPQYAKKNSASLRFWHWANTIVISGSLITVLINSTITNRGKVSFIIQNSLKESGGSLNKDQVRSIAHDLGDSVWDVHVYFGYFLGGVVFVQINFRIFSACRSEIYKENEKRIFSV